MCRKRVSTGNYFCFCHGNRQKNVQSTKLKRKKNAIAVAVKGDCNPINCMQLLYYSCAVVFISMHNIIKITISSFAMVAVLKRSCNKFLNSCFEHIEAHQHYIAIELKKILSISERKSQLNKATPTTTTIVR